MGDDRMIFNTMDNENTMQNIKSMKNLKNTIINTQPKQVIPSQHKFKVSEKDI